MLFLLLFFKNLVFTIAITAVVVAAVITVVVATATAPGGPDGYDVVL